MAKGNPFGQVRAKPFREALMMELAAAGEDRKALRVVAQALIGKAMMGDTQAIGILLDRTDGKVPQAIENSDEGAFKLEVAWKSNKSSSTTIPDHNSFPSITEQSDLPALSPTDEPVKP